MRRTLFHLATSLVTFGLGVTLAAFWLGLRAPASLDGGQKRARKQSCRWTAAPAPPAFVAAPAPPAPAEQPCELSGDWAADADPAARQPIRGGLLNGKAVSKPAPAYPAEARAAGLSGTVAVEVTIDECGRVEAASALSGPTPLWDASVEAARSARFAPTRLSGRPVKVSGVITYNYVLQ